MLYEKCHLPTFAHLLNGNLQSQSAHSNFIQNANKKLKEKKKNEHLKIFAFLYLNSKNFKRKSYSLGHLHGKYFLFHA